MGTNLGRKSAARSKSCQSVVGGAVVARGGGGGGGGGGLLEEGAEQEERKNKWGEREGEGRTWFIYASMVVVVGCPLGPNVTTRTK